MQRVDEIPLLHAVYGNLYLGQLVKDLSLHDEFRCVHFAHFVRYEAYCDDFGPMNMSSTISFIRLLDAEIASFPNAKILVCASDGPRALTNAVFLLGAYMIIKLDMTPSQVDRRFLWIGKERLESFRDATYSRADFRLHLSDCWRGLQKGKELGWVRYGGASYLWGQVDLEEYAQYDSPANGNLHEVVPGKFVAMQGPEDLGGADYRDDARGGRSFSPAFYAEILLEMGVGTVVRLNEPRYAADELTSRGFVHHSLEFDDCTIPPDSVVNAFLCAADAEPGAVAVHCKAGLGRTGTLIALWLMRTQGFGAREAMGWLRIMRPGSVIGEQQLPLRCRGGRPRRIFRIKSPRRSLRAADATCVGGGRVCRHCGGACGAGGGGNGEAQRLLLRAVACGQRRILSVT